MANNKEATAALWAAMAPTYEKILDHGFIQGLTDGTLPEETFAGYLVQDAFYLEEYGRCLALLAARSQEVKDLTMFSDKIVSSLMAEQELQSSLLASLGHDRQALMAAGEPSPTCFGFTGFIKNACTNAEYHAGFVAVMECPWAYFELGRALLAKGSPHPLYQQWIDSYASANMEEATFVLHEMWERIARSLSPEALQVSHRYAERAIRFDWMFWDAAYRRETWPV